MTMQKVKLTGKTKKLTKTEKALEDAEFRNLILEDVIAGTYDDINDMFSVLRYIKEDLESPQPDTYRARKALNAFTTLLINCQRTMMECADMEY